MASTTITIPDFDFSTFYYGEILEALIKYKRINVPELTEESEVEPSIQMLRAYALVGHLNNVLLDMVANEGTLPTAKLAETVRNMLQLIDYTMQSATPAQVDLVYELSRIFTAQTLVISEDAQAATKKENDDDPVFFEALTALTIDRGDQHSYVLSEEDGSFTDHTTDANSAVTPGDDWTPWTTPVSKDAIYWGHKQIMWDKLSVTLTTAMANITGVFEFYDGDWRKIAPTSVTNLGSTLRFDVTSLLGYSNRQGTKIRVQLNSTTTYEEVYSTWTGSANIIETTGLLGQTSTPSTTASDYTVGSDWSILEVTDTTSDFTVAGAVSYTLPQTISQNWIATEIDSKTAYWLRFRIITVNTPTSPTFQQTRMDAGKQYVLRSTTQGKTHTEDPLGSSVGLADQIFETAKDNFISGSETVTVDGDEWTRVDNFLNSESGSKHYQIKLGDNDRASVVFGGGGKGQIPPVGAGNIAITYRYGANNNGNVGFDKVVIDKTGLTYINRLWNPRAATGWKEAQGSTEETLEQAKIEGPASLRVGTVALGPDDVVDLTKRFTDDDGASPFSRALAFEEGFGPKTIELVVVAAGGGLASSAQLDEIEEYFNGNKYSNPPKAKHLVANQEVTAVNYNPKTIDVTVTVYGDVEKALIENKLNQILQPEALEEDGITYLWSFGESVPASKISSEIFKVDTSITNVVMSSSDVSLQTRELPTPGTFTITIVTP